MRLFIAAYPSTVALDHLEAVIGDLAVGRAAGRGINVRLTPPERRHVTMAFLGEVADSRLPDVCGSVAGAMSAWRTAGGQPPGLRLGGGGRFGRGRFTVLWVGLRGDAVPLKRLAGTVGRSLRQARLPLDRAVFRPHLTLARPGDRVPREMLDDDVTVLDRYDGPQWTVDSLALVSSQLGPDPVHRTVQTFPVG